MRCLVRASRWRRARQAGKLSTESNNRTTAFPAQERSVLINTDYLVVGSGASGLAFVDALVAEADVEVTLIDRRRAHGGHWPHAYPFVRLHSPSAYYGVNSLPLGEDRIDRVGENAGYYERATGEEVCDYFAQAALRLTRTGRRAGPHPQRARAHRARS